MTAPTSEARDRILIDDLLRVAGWNPTDSSQVRAGVEPLELTCHPSVKGEDTAESKRTESVSFGSADYVLLDQCGSPLAVIEAKNAGINPGMAKQGVLPHAMYTDAPFIFLTDGEVIYFWDYKNDDARIVDSFYTRRDLERLVYLRSEMKPMARVEIPEFYSRNGEARLVRPYQVEAMKALDRSVELGRRRFLLELPTGCGKTDLTLLYLNRMFQAGRAERILFLVDRDQLAKQTIDAVQDLLRNYSSYWLRPGVEAQEKQITVCLLQTMIGRHRDFSSGYFDVVVMDECHRSIYGAWQSALSHFDAFHVGLTATPAKYIERNTFEFYHCRNGVPDYSYPMGDAFEDGYLIPYIFASGITTLLTGGASGDGSYYDPAEFERSWTNEATNKLMMQEFDGLAWENYKELAPGQKDGPGKSIVFAITKHHASRLAMCLNELHPEYGGAYAEVITSDVADAEGAIRRFKHEKLPMIAVSVGMLDTGFDCRELLHLVICRRVRSPILYQQMRGRGTRTAPQIDKRRFVIYDFFDNHKYFKELDVEGYASGSAAAYRKSGSHLSPRAQEVIDLGLADEWMESVRYLEIGPDGEKVDKHEYVADWERVIGELKDLDPAVSMIMEGITLSEDEEVRLAHSLNKPDRYFNEENLRQAYRKPGGSFLDFIREALGMVEARSHEDVVDENFRAWLARKNFSLEQVQYISLLKNRGSVNGRITLDDLFSPPLSLLNAAGVGLDMFGERGLVALLDEINGSVLAV